MQRETNVTLGSLIGTRVKFLWPVSGHKNITKLLNKTQNTSSSKHWNKCELYIRFRKMNKNEEDHSFPTRWLYFRVSGGRSLSRQLRAPGGPRPGQGTLPLQSPSHPHSRRLGQCRHTDSPHVPSLPTFLGKDTLLSAWGPVESKPVCFTLTQNRVPNRPFVNRFLSKLRISLSHPVGLIALGANPLSLFVLSSSVTWSLTQAPRACAWIGLSPKILGAHSLPCQLPQLSCPWLGIGSQEDSTSLRAAPGVICLSSTRWHVSVDSS